MTFKNISESVNAILAELFTKTSENHIEWTSYQEKKMAMLGGSLEREFKISEELEEKGLVEYHHVSVNNSFYCRFNYSKNSENEKYIRLSVIYLVSNVEGKEKEIYLIVHRENKDVIQILTDSTKNKELEILYELILWKSIKEFKIIERLLFEPDQKLGKDKAVEQDELND
ncbi:hypothetical protein GC101_34130 [Paenibacillus sp. LMG 31459]|uniref:Uncharacterized protein n=1 Tax=Paenibacillus phytohabitans TaxID=2654978 RepID=A0ABX1YS32_9BACL|nr:hypothetical protein [Paenibacillus phytohabitans]NOU83895.1 hypothetical protein [Paenibacillus phytohabitans]